MCVKHRSKRGEILRLLAHVSCDETGAGVAREYAVALREKLFPAECGAVEAPIRMRGEFFVALIASIGGQEECRGICRMEHDEDAQFRGTREERIQPLVIDSKKVAIAVAQPQAQILP